MKTTSFSIITIFVIIACKSQYTEGLRILGLFPVNGKSHFVMCESLAKGLAAKGHQIDVYSHFPLKKSIPNYKDFSLAGTLPNSINNISYDNFIRFQTPNIGKLLATMANPNCELMKTPVFQELFESLKKDQPYDVVIIETFIANCLMAWGRHLDIPMVGVMSAGLIDWYNEPLGNPFNPATTPSLFSGLFHPMNFWERLTNTFMYYVITTQFNYYISEQNKYVEQIFGPGYPDVSELPKDLDLLLINAHHALEGIRAYTPAIVPVAGLHVIDDGIKLTKEVQKWLDESKAGCIYVSFGSMVRIETFPKSILDAFYASFKNIAPVRVLMKIAKPEELPTGLPSNVMTQSWFPQIQVLKHRNIKAFVTHGGLMSTLEATYAGVPLIGIPLFGDQHVNIRGQVKRKAATMLELKDITEKTMTAAINDILTDPIYKSNMENFSKKLNDRPMSPMETAVFWIEYIVRHGKGSLRSPIVDMPWYQSHLIDIYAFILLILVALYFILKLSFKVMKKVCCSKSSEQQQKEKKKRISRKTD